MNKKKIFLPIATGLFVAATLFNVNLLKSNNAGDVSLDAIATMAQAVTENNDEKSDYKRGITGRNWQTYTITCTYENTTQTNTSNYGGSYSSSSSVNVAIPRTPVTVSGSYNASAYYNKSSTTTQSTRTITIKKDVCGSGSGWCWNPAPNGNPCM